ncbi:MAG: hypothetical protein AAGF12_06260 [Myxococcota bacterium]
MIAVIITIAGGLIAASNLIVSRMANAQTVIDKLTPYQGWIGAVMFVWGIKEIIFSITGLGMLSTSPLLWVFWLLVGLADLLVGFLLAFGLITKYALSKNQQAMEKGQRIRAKLAPFQGILGLFAIVMGVLYAVWLFVL